MHVHMIRRDTLDWVHPALSGYFVCSTQRQGGHFALCHRGRGALCVLLRNVCNGGKAMDVLCVTASLIVSMSRSGALLLLEACTAWPVLQGDAHTYGHFCSPVFLRMHLELPDSLKCCYQTV
jgi:hypothetical protein